MSEGLVERVARRVEAIIQRPMFVKVEASGRHAHLSREAVDILFGKGHSLTKQADLSQPGQFSCRERIRVIGPKAEFPSVVVLGPERKETQIEISNTDAIVLGIPAVIRQSGDLTDTPSARLAGPAGELTARRGVIVAQRHIHITPGDAALYGVRDGQVVSVHIWNRRSVTFNNVVIRVSAHFATYMHIDYDEANACGFQNGMIGLIEL